MTRSGKICQHWNLQAPHKFILPFQQYPELGDHNYCRNPGSKGPDGPWCFTTDPNTRWEYCNVPKCGKVFVITYLAILSISCYRSYLLCNYVCSYLCSYSSYMFHTIYQVL